MNVRKPTDCDIQGKIKSLNWTSCFCDVWSFISLHATVRIEFDHGWLCHWDGTWAQTSNSKQKRDLPVDFLWHIASTAVLLKHESIKIIQSDLFCDEPVDSLSSIIVCQTIQLGYILAGYLCQIQLRYKVNYVYKIFNTTFPKHLVVDLYLWDSQLPKRSLWYS